MMGSIAELSPHEVIFAANFLGEMVLETSFREAGESAETTEGKFEALRADLAALAEGGDFEFDEAALAERFRPVLQALANSDSPIAELADRALSQAEGSGETYGWGDEGARLVIAIGIAIALVLVVSQTKLTGQLGPIAIDKGTEFPPQIVQIVQAIADAAAKARKAEE